MPQPAWSRVRSLAPARNPPPFRRRWRERKGPRPEAPPGGARWISRGHPRGVSIAVLACGRPAGGAPCRSAARGCSRC